MRQALNLIDHYSGHETGDLLYASNIPWPGSIQCILGKNQDEEKAIRKDLIERAKAGDFEAARMLRKHYRLRIIQ